MGFRPIRLIEEWRIRIVEPLKLVHVWIPQDKSAAMHESGAARFSHPVPIRRRYVIDRFVVVDLASLAECEVVLMERERDYEWPRQQCEASNRKKKMLGSLFF